VSGLSQRARGALAVVGLVAVAVLGYFLLISPNRSAAADLDEQIEATQSQIDDRRARSRVQPAPPLDVRDLFRLTRAMPDEAHIPEVILELDRLASRSGVSFQSISPQAPVEQQGYRAVPITVIADGRFFSVSGFLGRLRNLVRLDGGKLKARGRLLTVDSVSFAEGAKLFPNVRATLTVNAFVFGGGAGAKAGEKAAPPPAGADTNPLQEGS
jgi:Tfp pilus assembly protein PilO